jgi:hypothetical protein
MARVKVFNIEYIEPNMALVNDSNFILLVQNISFKIFKRALHISNHSAIALGLSINSSVFEKNDLILIDFNPDGFFIYSITKKYKPVLSLTNTHKPKNAKFIIESLNKCINKNCSYDILFNNCHSFSNLTIEDGSLLFNFLAFFLMFFLFLYFLNK